MLLRKLDIIYNIYVIVSVDLLNITLLQKSMRGFISWKTIHENDVR